MDIDAILRGVVILFGVVGVTLVFLALRWVWRLITNPQRIARAAGTAVARAERLGQAFKGAQRRSSLSPHTQPEVFPAAAKSPEVCLKD